MEMSNRWILVRNDVIENVVLASAQPSLEGVTVLPDPGGVGPGHRLVDGAWVAPLPPVPDRSTNASWRKALRRMGKFAQVDAIVEAAKAGGTVEGEELYEEFHYANHVYRERLLELAPTFGFTLEEVDESLRLAGAD
jgi:hypothetical protein